MITNTIACFYCLLNSTTLKALLKKVILASFVSSLIFSACQQEIIPQPETDIRDLYVGHYACEVIKKNFQTNLILESYKDTIEVVKLGESGLTIHKTKKVQLPDVTIMDAGRVHPMYVAQFTIVVFNYDTINNKLIDISHGHDSAFYQIKGIMEF
jgi:hypothetical protein